MELRLETPAKFQHPCYEVLTWLAAHNLLKEIKGKETHSQYMCVHFNVSYVEIRKCWVISMYRMKIAM